MNADELQAMQALNLAVDGYRERAEAAEARLAAANALLGRLHRENVRWSGTGTTQLARDVDAHLSAQPATAPEASDDD